MFASLMGNDKGFFMIEICQDRKCCNRKKVKNHPGKYNNKCDPYKYKKFLFLLLLTCAQFSTTFFSLYMRNHYYIKVYRTHGHDEGDPCIRCINLDIDGGKIMDILGKLKDYREEEKELKWQGTFSEYIEIIKQRPEVAQTATSRVYHMIKSFRSTKEDGSKTYHFFGNEIFGLEDSIERLVEEYFHPAAKRLDVRKRILLLMGPVSGGKSTIVTMLKRGLEKYSRTEDRKSTRLNSS